MKQETRILDIFCCKAEQMDFYENLNYSPLVKLMKKLLPHGIPELPKIHKQLEKNFLPNGYIPVEIFLRILNANRCLSDNVKKMMTGKMDDIYFEININHILACMETEEALTWFDLTTYGGVPMIRSNFEHTLSIVDPLILSKENITKEYLIETGMLIYLRIRRCEVKKFMTHNVYVRHKTFKFWTSIHPSHYEDTEEDKKEWLDVLFDGIGAIDMGFSLFFIEGRVFCTRKDIPKSAKTFFIIPNVLFMVENDSN